ncbi:hypothetical protein JHW43_004111 [Diplocarpon mali]|nr:hypothetical protein JHW43_004111 [Diplocarpon mali]
MNFKQSNKVRAKRWIEVDPAGSQLALAKLLVHRWWGVLTGQGSGESGLWTRRCHLTTASPKTAQPDKFCQQSSVAALLQQDRLLCSPTTLALSDRYACSRYPEGIRGASMAPNGEGMANGEADVLNASAAEDSWSVEAVVASLPGGAPQTESSSPVPFFHLLERLKTTKREGWRRFGITSGESISDHMYRMSIITMLAPPSLSAKLNIPHCTKMALVHDMAEALVGDITPVDGVAKHEKNRRESTTMDYLTNGLLGRVNGGITGKELKAVWQEYEDSVTPESQFVHDVDKIELILQMVEYERVHEQKLDLGEFSWVATRIVMPEVKEWSDALLQEREEFWGGKEHSIFNPDGSQVEAGKLEYYAKPDAKVNGDV